MDCYHCWQAASLHCQGPARDCVIPARERGEGTICHGRADGAAEEDSGDTRVAAWTPAWGARGAARRGAARHNAMRNTPREPAMEWGGPVHHCTPLELFDLLKAGVLRVALHAGINEQDSGRGPALPIAKQKALIQSAVKSAVAGPPEQPTRHKNVIPPSPTSAPAPPPPPRVTLCRVAVFVRGPGQSPVLPFACCVGVTRRCRDK